MEAGDFELTGETIIFDNKWNLINGQHRLNGCILAKKPFQALVVQGVPPRVYLKLDSGDKRRAADWMHHLGEDNAKVMAAALRILWTFDEGSLCSNKQYPSNDEIKHTLDSHPGLRKFNTSTFAKSVKGMPGSLTMALRYIFGQYDEKLATQFFEHLATGERLTKQNPVLFLRERLLGAQGKNRLSQVECAALTIKTWNAFVGGGEFSPHHLRFRTGKGGEEMPRIIGIEYDVGIDCDREALDVTSGQSCVSNIEHGDEAASKPGVEQCAQFVPKTVRQNPLADVANRNVPWVSFSVPKSALFGTTPAGRQRPT